MTGAAQVRRPRRAARVVLVGVTSLAALLGSAAGAPTAGAAPTGAVMRPTTVSVRADEIVTVDVLSNDDPPPGAAWDRASVCLVLAAGCRTASSVDGFSWSVDAQGALRYSQTSRFGGVAGIEYQVRDSRGATWRSRFDLTTGLTARERPSACRRAAPTPAGDADGQPDDVRPRRAGAHLDLTGDERRDVPLPVTVTDDSSSVSARTCTPVADGATLAPGASTTCTATATVRQDVLDGRQDRRDAVPVAATSTADGQRYRTAASATATSTAVQTRGCR